MCVGDAQLPSDHPLNSCCFLLSTSKFVLLFNNVVSVVCPASLPIAVLGQPGWYTLSALVSQISDSVQVPTLSRIVARVSDGPRLELRSRQVCVWQYVYMCVCMYYTLHGTLPDMEA